MKIVDCRGLACPQPVLSTKKALEEAGPPLVTIVDNEAARENVARFARSQGCLVRIEEEGGCYRLHITRGTEPAGAPAPPGAPAPAGGIVPTGGTVARGPMTVLLSGDRLGRGSEELGGILMRSFLYTLTQQEDPPGALICVNGGVRLTTEGSPALEELRILEEKGTEILSCGTCLDFFGLKDKLKIGRVTNMYEIVERLGAAARALYL